MIPNSRIAFCLVWSLLFAVAPAAVGAAGPGNLYDAEVPIQTQSPEDRNRAIGEAFKVVLVRLLGSEDALAQPGVAEVIKSAPRLVRQYRFRWDEAAPAGSRQLLAVQFDEGAVNRVLREKHLTPQAPSPAPSPAPQEVTAEPPSGYRPTVLMWLATERSGHRDFATPETDPRLLAAANSAARDRGAPLLFPLYDLEDRSQLGVPDLWGLRIPGIEVASHRYAPDRVLVGLVSGSDGAGWSGRWTLLDQQDVLADWSTRGGSPSAVVQAGISDAVDRLSAGAAPRSAEPPFQEPRSTQTPAEVPGTSPTPLEGQSPIPIPAQTQGLAIGPVGDLLPVQVAGVQRLADFLRAEKYLAGLSGVTQVRVLGVSSDAVVFGIGPARSDGAARAIGSGQVLKSDPGMPASGGPPGMLRYRLQP